MPESIIYTIQVVSLMIVVTFLFNKYRKFDLSYYRIWRHETIEGIAPNQVENVISNLILNKHVYKLSMKDNLIAFQDRFSVFSASNYYVVELDNISNEATIYRRGMLFVYHGSKSNFNNMVNLFRLASRAK